MAFCESKGAGAPSVCRGDSLWHSVNQKVQGYYCLPSSAS